PAPWEIMATVMAAGMVPPLAMALATALRPRVFSQAEKENGKAAWLLGAAFISEGAIPFAASDPLRVIPASVVGAGVTGGMTMGLSVTSQAPHGGVFVFFAIDSFLFFLLAIAVGTVISALLVLVLKIFVRKGGSAGLDGQTQAPAGTSAATAPAADQGESAGSNADASLRCTHHDERRSEDVGRSLRHRSTPRPRRGPGDGHAAAGHRTRRTARTAGPGG